MHVHFCIRRDLRFFFLFIGHIINKLNKKFSKINGSDLFEVLANMPIRCNGRNMLVNFPEKHGQQCLIEERCFYFAYLAE
jgi:hypothetical protein